MTRPWTTIASVPTAEGALELRRRGGDGDRADFLIVVGGRVLMTSAARRSEEVLATLACAPIAGRPAPRVLIGGLGMAFTLRAALDALPATARVVVAELNADVVSWCRGPLAAATGGAASDGRVSIEIADVAAVIAGARAGRYDAIVLDLYEGPYAATQRRDDPFYGPAALARSRAALAKGGVMAVWAEDHDVAFERRFAAAGFAVTVHREGRGGRTHVVYLGTRVDKRS
jgi:spermidine synthase